MKLEKIAYDSDYFYILGDIHLDAPEFAKEAFERAKDIIGESPVIIMGDIMDWGFFDDLIGQLKRAAAALDERMSREEMISYMETFVYDSITKALLPFKNIVAIVEGNHDVRGAKRIGQNFLRFYAKQRNVPYIEGQGLIDFRGKKVVVTHGARGGRRQSAPLNELDDIARAWEGVDIVIIGHHHKFVHSVVARMTSELQKRYVHLIAVPAFLDWAIYAQKKGYTPPFMGVVKVALKDRTRVEVIELG